mmetsp:Transcript_8091/g.19117  ORF Transcript_8091/g.19117 Transcript_8091/m.19117 type:complete len:211 (-) Transcript_8091:9-641(-)
MTMRRKILAVCALACHVFMAAAFSPAVPLLSSSITERSVQGRVRQACSPTMQAVSEGEQHINRRNFLQGIALTGVVSTFPVAAFADADDDRIKAGYDTLVDLLDNWGKYAGEGKEAVNGDNVRRQIGTVGSKSPLFNIRKVLLRKGVDIDLFESFEKEYAQIEANSYSAIFADYSTSPKRGYQYIDDAKTNCKETLKIYKQIMKELDIKP